MLLFTMPPPQDMAIDANGKQILIIRRDQAKGGDRDSWIIKCDWQIKKNSEDFTISSRVS